MPMHSILTLLIRSSDSSKELGHCLIPRFSISLNRDEKALPMRSKLRLFSFIFNRMSSVNWTKLLWSLVRTIFENFKLIYSMSIRTLSFPIRRFILSLRSRYQRSIHCLSPLYRSPFSIRSMIVRHAASYYQSWVVSQSFLRFQRHQQRPPWHRLPSPRPRRDHVRYPRNI